MLRPGEVTWIDVIVPAGAPGWSADIHAPMVWLGRHLAAAMSAVFEPLEPEIGDLHVHEGPLRSTAWSKLVCFDGVGAGEVLLGGRKLVGVSQRRTRHAARLQCCWYSSYDDVRLVGLLASQVRPEPSQLAAVATLPAGTADDIVARLAATLA